MFPVAGLDHPDGDQEEAVAIEVESVCVSEESADDSDELGVSRDVDLQKWLTERDERFGGPSKIKGRSRTASWRRRISDITLQKIRKARAGRRSLSDTQN